MASSIKTGLKEISKRSIGFLIVQADMPLISKKIIDSLCYSIRNNNKEIVAPIYKSNMGNPIGFKRSMTRILNKTSGDSGAKKMIKRNKKNLSLIRVNSKSIFKDFNTQRDFLLN
jgi:molybdenum cofactor cytidylyltransferase